MIKLHKFNFEGPYNLKNFDYLNKACIYAILCKNNINTYRVIYIGQTGGLGERINNHNKLACWLNQCNIENLYIAFLLMPTIYYSKEDRLKLESELIKKFDPECNKI